MKNSSKKWPIETQVSWLVGGISLTFILACPFVLLVILIASATLNAYLAWEVSGMTLLINKPASAPTVVAIAPPIVASSPTSTATSTPTIIPTATATPGPPTPTPHPLADYTIEGLRERTYPGGVIRVRSVLTETDSFTRYYIDYPSDGLSITGIMQIPQGEGPFPVIILNHGYIPREDYWSGADTAGAAGYLNRRGYLTIAPDFRSWGESDTDNSFFSTGQLIDALNLVSSLPSVPEADLERVGMWGHSMGGGITMKAITVDPRIKAAVLYAPVSADDAEVLARWGPGCESNQTIQLADQCAGAEVLVSGIDERLFWAYADAVQNPKLLWQTSPINYVPFIVSPVQIHIGLADRLTPPEWSATIHERLQEAGKQVEFFTYPGQGHALKGRSWNLFMERVSGFFDRHLSDAPELAER